MRVLIAAVWVMISTVCAGAQGFSGLARLDPTQSVIRDDKSTVEVDLWLSQAVPWRVFTLTDPRRLVVDFREVDWRGITRETLLQSEVVSDVRFGMLRPGWSRLIADLEAPMIVDTAGMQVDPIQGTAHVHLVLTPGTQDAFAAASGAPSDPGWDDLAALDVTRAPPADPEDGVLVVAIDPGHGGLDPGAEYGGVRESDLMLSLAQDLGAAIARTDGMRAVLTRSNDMFVPLQARLTIARAAGAEVFVSLHADALEYGQAAGASVYLLDPDTHDDATRRMAERHGRDDLVAGLDLDNQDDTIAKLLLEMARRKTSPQSARLQQSLIAGMAKTNARLNTRPARAAELAVLMAADFPSVLIEVGFLTNDADRAALQTAQGRAPIVAGIILGLRKWARAEATRPD